ncbi:MAG: diguanylate cyclase [Helicobacteraceae bacterium]|nr:diguanylate cyclase [Helicobacteraceae bacterium]
MSNTQAYLTDINDFPINIVIYEIKDDEIYFHDLNNSTQTTENIERDDLIGKKLIDVFPGVKEFGLYDRILKVYKTGKNEDFDLKFYEDERISGWKKNRVVKIAGSFVMVMYEDLTELHNLNKALEEKTQEQRLIFDINPNIIFTTNGVNIIDANKKFLKFTCYDTLEEFKKDYNCICDLFESRVGYLSAEINGVNWVEYVKNNSNTINRAIIKKDDMEFVFSVHADSYSEGKSLVVLEDISMIQQAASTDFLTQLYNREKMNELLVDAVNNFKRYSRGFSLIMVDVDFFKSVNDTYGHGVGDRVLKEISEMLQKHTRVSDSVSRWGGEEFLILCPEATHDGAYNLAENIRKAIGEYDFKDVGTKTVSLGVATINKEACLDQLLIDVDRALYKAKNSGRNRTEIL